MGRLTRKDMMPLTPILEVEIFDLWGIDFIRPFQMSYDNQFILVTIDYVSKWAKTVPTRTNDNQVVIKFLRENIISRFGAPRAIISDNGRHFCNRAFKALMRKYSISHKLTTAYHPQTNGQVEVTNRQIKLILEKTIGQSRKDCSIKLVNALWAYQTAYKTILGMSPYRVIFEKSCHFLVDLEHRALWAIRQLNFDLKKAGDLKKL